MSTKDFRSAVVSEVEAWATASFPGMPVCHENGPEADEATIGPIWMDLHIRWYGCSIASMGVTPRLRERGAVSATCYYRKTNGTEQTDLVVDSLRTLLGVRHLGGAVMGAPQRTTPSDALGWYRVSVLVPFTLG